MPTPDLATPKVPRGLRPLGGSGGSSGRFGRRNDHGGNNKLGQEIKSEAAAVERWWSQPRWQHTKRVYSGAFRFALFCVVLF